MASKHPHNALPAGYRLGEYAIESVLGHGGFGITYLAQDTKLSSRVAVKEYFPRAFASRTGQSTIVPNPTEAENYQWGLQEFLKEARALAKFKHNHIVRVLRFLEANSTAYMVMEYEEGESLAYFLRKSGGYLNEQTLLGVFLPILSGLQAVHDAGLLHLDIKPENIYMRANGQPMLIDFGSARQTKGKTDKDQKIALTPAYAALEHYPNLGTPGPWTDVYSIGASLYRCMTGSEPVGAMERYQTIRKKKTDPLRPAADFDRPFYAPYIRESVDCALKLFPKERPKAAFTLQRGLMGHGMSNDQPTQQSAVNVTSGFIGIARVVQQDMPEHKEGSFGRKLVGALVVLAIAVFGLKFLVEKEIISDVQLHDGMARVEQAVAGIAKKAEQAVLPSRDVHSPKVGTASATRKQNNAEPKLATGFETSKVLIQSLTGHQDLVRSLAFIDNGRVLASASADGLVKLWDVETGTLQQTFNSDESNGGSIAVSPDGRWLAAAGDSNTIKLWSAANSNVEGKLTALSSAGINQMTFSPDGQLLAAAIRDRSVILWDTNKLEVAGHITDFRADVLTLAFSPKGRWLATGDASGEIKYWDAATGKLLGYFRAHEEKVTSIAVSSDGRWLATGGPSNFLKVWDTGLERRDRTFIGAPNIVHSVKFTPDSKWLIVGGTSDAIQIWDVQSGELARQLYGHDRHIYTVALSRDGKLLAAGGDDETVRVWR